MSPEGGGSEAERSGVGPFREALRDHVGGKGENGEVVGIHIPGLVHIAVPDILVAKRKQKGNAKKNKIIKISLFCLLLSRSFSRPSCSLSRRTEQSCQANAYTANIEFNVSTHGEHIRDRKAPTENSNLSRLHK